MKRILILLLFLPLASLAQITFQLKGFVNDKISGDIKSGDRIELRGIASGWDDANLIEGNHKALVLVNGTEEEINPRELDKIDFEVTNIKEFWQNQMIKYESYRELMKNGMQYDLRKDVEEDVLEYLKYINENNLVFRDAYLESYLYSLIYKIYPDRLDDGRPGILNVKIIKDLEPNAGIFPNGTMVINTGLLSTINSEEELIAVLSHEISHFVLDHSVININKEEQRKKRAEFWAALATGVAAAGDVYLASNNAYYTPGILTAGTAILSYSIASSVNKRLGQQFSRDQELEADKSAVELMNYINVNPLALSSALEKIKKYSIQSGNYLALTGEGSHPAIDDRINAIGEPGQFGSIDFDKGISLVNSYNAILELNDQHFISSAELAKRNIDASVATEEDYVLLAMCTMYMNDTAEKNQEALNLINKAKSLNTYPTINMYKQEAIALIRLNRLAEARNSLLRYKEAVEERMKSLERPFNVQFITADAKYLVGEYEWCSKMISKVTKL